MDPLTDELDHSAAAEGTGDPWKALQSSSRVASALVAELLRVADDVYESSPGAERHALLHALERQLRTLDRVCNEQIGIRDTAHVLSQGVLELVSLSGELPLLRRVADVAREVFEAVFAKIVALSDTDQAFVVPSTADRETLEWANHARIENEVRTCIATRRTICFRTDDDASSVDRVADEQHVVVSPMFALDGRFALIVGRAESFTPPHLRQIAYLAEIASVLLSRELTLANYRTSLQLCLSNEVTSAVVAYDRLGVVILKNQLAQQMIDDGSLDTSSVFDLTRLEEETVVDESVSSGSRSALRTRRFEGGHLVVLSAGLGTRATSSPKRSIEGGGRRRRHAFEDLVGRAPSFLSAIELARRGARTLLPVLITGESGTGKELVAQAIHEASSRRREPFVAINVAAVPHELMESEFFGHVRGAFTGARNEGLEGKLELAGEGCLLLDEIGDMPLALQSKLLRVLQERRFRRLGSNREIPFSARIVATTHHDLEIAVSEGRFRLDLFYRLRGINIHLPPLRERTEDIPVLVQHILHGFSSDGVDLRVSDELMKDLLVHDWPGNVRELVHFLEAEVALLDPGVTQIVGSTFRGRDRRHSSPETPVQTAETTLDEVMRRALVEALRLHHGNVSRAARALAISRATFYRRLRSYGLAAPRSLRAAVR